MAALPATVTNATISTGTIAAHMRVSTDEQRERATIETQHVEVEKYAAARSITLAGLYADDGWSGRKLS